MSAVSTTARCRTALATSWASFRFFERISTRRPAVGGKVTPSFCCTVLRTLAPAEPCNFDRAAATCRSTPSERANWSTRGRRLSTTSPLSVEMAALPPLRTLSSSRCAVRLAVRHACCTLGEASSRGAACPASC